MSVTRIERPLAFGAIREELADFTARALLIELVEVYEAPLTIPRYVLRAYRIEGEVYPMTKPCVCPGLAKTKSSYRRQEAAAMWMEAIGEVLSAETFEGVRG